MFRPVLAASLACTATPAAAHIGDHSALNYKTLGLHLLEAEHVVFFFATLTFAAIADRIAQHVQARVLRKPEQSS
jgi:hypothetical protein